MIKQLFAQLLVASFFVSTCLGGVTFPPTGMWSMSGSSACTSGQIVGWSTAAATEQVATAYQAVAIKRTVSCTATSGTFNAWLGNDSGLSRTWIAIVAADSSGKPEAVIWRSSAQTIPASSAVALRSVSFSGVSITPGDYHLILWESNNVSGVIRWTYTASSGEAKYVSSSLVGTDTDLSSLSWLDSTAERAINVTF